VRQRTASHIGFQVARFSLSYDACERKVRLRGSSEPRRRRVPPAGALARRCLLDEVATECPQEHGRTSASSVGSDFGERSRAEPRGRRQARRVNRWIAEPVDAIGFEPPQGGDTLRRSLSPPCGGFLLLRGDGDHGFTPVARGLSPLRGLRGLNTRQRPRFVQKAEQAIPSLSALNRGPTFWRPAIKPPVPPAPYATESHFAGTR
jgi:hypothetical protein